MRRVLDNFIRISSNHGDKTSLSHFGKHLGTDYSVPVGASVKAPVNGTVVQSVSSASLGNYYEIKEDGNGRLHRICHLSTRPLGPGARITEGQEIAKSGNTGITTGAHVHHDIRKANTAWNASFENYYDPEKLLAPPPTPAPKLPDTSAVKSFRVKPGFTFRVYKPGTTTVLGTIDHSWGWYQKRGYDAKYPNRWLGQSATYGQFAFPYADVAGNSYLHEIEVIK